MNLLRRGVTTFRRAAKFPKAHYMRLRPFVRFGEPTLDMRKARAEFKKLSTR